MKVRNEKTIDLCSKDIKEAIAEWVSDEHPEVMLDTAKYEFDAHRTDEGETLFSCKITIIEED